MPAFVDTTMNVEHVDDLALGHVAALERGRSGRSYILGGDNLSMQSILELLAECTDLPAPTRRVPKAVALAAGVASQLVEGRLLRREPNVSIEAARMSTTHMRFDDSRARREIGYTSRPARDAIEDSARWFVENGYVSAQRRARITWVK
jgi:dihydroflavonol-4-reductase